MNIKNEDIKEILVEIPEGHRHIRTKIILQDDTELVLQEAAVANITRAYNCQDPSAKRSSEIKGQTIN